MAYEVRSGHQTLGNLGPEGALAKLRELLEAGADPYLYDSFGDPMGRAELEWAVQSVGFGGDD